MGTGIVIGETYRHFKGNLYKIITKAVHTETGESMVVYQDVTDADKVYARPLAMFLSKVDKEKYPDVDQEYRFEIYDENKHKQSNDGKGPKLDSKVLKFLDVKSFSEKKRILEDIRPYVDDSMINTMAFSLDIEINEGDLEERFQELYSSVCLREKYEGDRLRK